MMESLLEMDDLNQLCDLLPTYTVQQDADDSNMTSISQALAIDMDYYTVYAISPENTTNNIRANGNSSIANHLIQILKIDKKSLMDMEYTQYMPNNSTDAKYQMDNATKQLTKQTTVAETEADVFSDKLVNATFEAHTVMNNTSDWLDSSLTTVMDTVKYINVSEDAFNSTFIENITTATNNYSLDSSAVDSYMDMMELQVLWPITLICFVCCLLLLIFTMLDTTKCTRTLLAVAFTCESIFVATTSVSLRWRQPTWITSSYIAFLLTFSQLASVWLLYEAGVVGYCAFRYFYDAKKKPSLIGSVGRLCVVICLSLGYSAPEIPIVRLRLFKLTQGILNPCTRPLYDAWRFQSPSHAPSDDYMYFLHGILGRLVFMHALPMYALGSRSKGIADALASCIKLPHKIVAIARTARILYLLQTIWMICDVLPLTLFMFRAFEIPMCFMPAQARRFFQYSAPVAHLSYLLHLPLQAIFWLASSRRLRRSLALLLRNRHHCCKKSQGPAAEPLVKRKVENTPLSHFDKVGTDVGNVDA